MSVYCSQCSRTGRWGEKVEMDWQGDHWDDDERVEVYQCPLCDGVKAVIHYRKGHRTSRYLSADEVATLPNRYAGLGAGLLILGALVAVGLVIAANSDGGE